MQISEASIFAEMDFIPLILTFCVALLIGLEFGMMCGFLISVTYLLYYAARPGVKVKKGYVSQLSFLDSWLCL